MKKSILAVLIILSFSISTAWAAPFIVCDPQAGVAYYILELNGVETPQFPAQPDGSMKYDLEPLLGGPFTLKAMAGNLWGWSDWSLPFMDTKALPQNPSGLHVSLE